MRISDLIVYTIQFNDRIFTCHTLLCCVLFISKIVSHREKLKEILCFVIEERNKKESLLHENI